MHAMYFSIDEAIEERERRSKIPGLKEAIDSYLEGDIPTILATGPRSVLFRNLFTPDCELDAFLTKASAAGLPPALFEYTDDLFIAKNKDKYALGKLYFYLDTKGNSETNMFAKKIIDFDAAEKRSIKDIETLWGENLVGFHHRLLSLEAHDLLESSYFECSDWLHRHGMVAKEYYKQFLALFIMHGILFDNFRDSDAESQFLTEVFYPACEHVQAAFGLEPLICALQKPEEENDPRWWGYPRERMESLLAAIPDHGSVQTQDNSA